MKLLKITLLAFVFTTGAFSQSKYVADKYFSQYAYTESADAYKKLYDSGNKSYEVISRIADSYYFNTKNQEAVKWYGILNDTYTEKIDTEHLFRYAQSLKSNGNYKKADSIMKIIDEIDSADTRPNKLLLKPDYVSDYTKPALDVLSFENLPVNTKYSDFGGFVSKGKLYFASARPTETSDKLYRWNNQPYLNLFTANIVSANNSYSAKNADLLTNPIQTKYHEATAVITRNGKIMYFTRDNHNNGKTGMSKDKKVLLKLYRAELIDGKWKNIVELPFNSDEYSVGHPALSPDEKTLYFISNMPGGFGYTDVYKVAILAGQKYGQPENLGQNINTEGREMFPYVSHDNTLYFSSDGHLGLGGLDVFESAVDNNHYGVVKNLEVPFNSPKDDFAFYIDAENKKGFISSNREGGKGDDDIYSFILREPKTKNKIASSTYDEIVTSNLTTNKNCEQMVTGITSDAFTGAILPNTTVRLIDYEGKVIDTITSSKQGVYKFKINCLTSYSIVGNKTDYRNDLKVVNATALDKGSNLVNLALQPLIVENQIKINPIYFDLDKSFIRPDAQYELENIVRVMNNNPDMKIRIESHTDCRASKNYNKALSERRAKSTRDYIISRGISSARIVSAIGYGEERLLNNCDDANKDECTEAQHQQNRRSYFYIVSGGTNIQVKGQ